MNTKFLVALLLIIITAPLISARDLRVTLSPDDRKVNRNTSDGVATIVFDSHVKGLTINDGTDDQWTQISENMFVFYVDTKRDLEREMEFSQRDFILHAPDCPEYLLEIKPIQPNAVLYYTVTIPDNYPLMLTAEYMYGLSSPYGVRISFGKRYGGYFSYRWGKYKKSGADIDNVTVNYDVKSAKEVGYIRTCITGGLNVGLLNRNWGQLFLYAGGGYGEYGRQWKNVVKVDGSRYFYSDYIRGVEAELGARLVYSSVTLSVGADILSGHGKVSAEVQVGLGISLSSRVFDKLLRRKRNLEL